MCFLCQKTTSNPLSNLSHAGCIWNNHYHIVVRLLRQVSCNNVVMESHQNCSTTSSIVKLGVFVRHNNRTCFRGNQEVRSYRSVGVFLEFESVAEIDDSSPKSQQQPRHSVVESFHTAKSIQSQVRSMMCDKRKS